MDEASTAIFLDGKFCQATDAKVSLLDRAYLLGDSVFETLRCYEGVPFRFQVHLDRLTHSARVLGIPLDVTPETLEAAILETVRRSGAGDAYVRVTLSRGEGGRGLSPRGCDHPVLSVIARPLQPYPAEAYQSGIRSITVQTRRIPAACLDPSIKCGNYLSSIQARRELDAHGMIEGVQLGVEGQVVSGTVSNVFIVRRDELLTPSLDSGCLPGVTRGVLLELAEGMGLPVVQARMMPNDLQSADEIFFCNTLMECLGVAELDGRRLPGAPGPLTTGLHAALRRRIADETMQFRASTTVAGPTARVSLRRSTV